MSAMYSDGYATYDTVGGVMAADDVMRDDVPTDAEGVQEMNVGADPADRSIVNRAWILIVVIGLGGLWLFGGLFRGFIQG